MKAIIASGYGGPEVLSVSEQAAPKPSANQIKVSVHYGNISRADTMMRTGKPYIGRLFTGLTKPKHPITGTGFAGRVEEVGSDVTNFNVGDCVYGESTDHFSAHAQYLCVDGQSLVRKIPEGMSLKAAASLCDGPLTAFNFLFELAHLSNKHKILINGASGSVGSAAVQLAKVAGAEVTAVCSRKNQGLVETLNADFIVHYDDADFLTQLSRYDVIFDAVGVMTPASMKPYLTKNGIFISPVLSIGLLARMLLNPINNQKVKFSATGLLPASKLHTYLAKIEKHLTNHQFAPLIDQEYQPEDIQAAHHYIDSGRKKGSALLNFTAG